MYQASKEQYYQNLHKKYPDEDFTILEFIDSSHAVTIQCNWCKKIYHFKHGTSLYDHRRKHFCSLCNSASVSKMYKACSTNDITILETASDVITPWVLQCNKCNYIFKRAPATWQQYTCPNCGFNHHKQPLGFYQARIDEYFGFGEFTIDYSPTHSDNFLFIHKCGYVKDTQMSAFMRSKGCPVCSKTMSKGERYILQFLEKNNIPYKSQARIPGTQQKFDFLINGTLAIEFNGKQHYEPIEIFGGVERFKQQQEYDTNKRRYCEKNNITLLVISYLQIDQIDTILADFFKKSNDQFINIKEN